MTVLHPPLRHSENTIRGKTVSREYGRKNMNEPNFNGEWVIRESDGTFVNFYHSLAHVERYYPGTMIVEFLGNN